MNAAEQYAMVMLHSIEGRRTLGESDQYPYETVFSLIHQGDKEANESIRAVRDVFSQAINTSSSFQLYPRPPFITSHAIKTVRMVFTTGEISELNEITEDEARSLFGDFSNPDLQNDARYWWWSQYDYRIGVGWPPQKAGSLEMHYVRAPKALDATTAFYSQSEITATFTRGDRTVTFSSGLPVSTIAEHDQLGRTGTADGCPSSWYYVDSVTVDGDGLITGVELSTEYDGPTESGALFVASRVSDFCKETSGSAHSGWAGVRYALWHLHETTDPDLANRNRAEFMRVKQLSAPDQSAMITSCRGRGTSEWGSWDVK